MAAVTAAASRTASLAAAARNAGSGISATARLSLALALAVWLCFSEIFCCVRGEEMDGWMDGWIGVAGSIGSRREDEEA